MRTQSPNRSALQDIGPRPDTLTEEVLRGLRQEQKQLPCKLFYDTRGAGLFDSICELPEYYPTRTEVAILRENAAGIAATVGAECLLVEYGSGSSVKTRILLDHLVDPAGYVPIDISRTHLLRAADRLARSYRQLEVLPVCADYTMPLDLPASRREPARKVVFFPGSTLGNFHPVDAVAFLRRIRSLVGPDGGLLIGIDTVKDPQILHAAYNDREGVTAEFNLNILARINRELDGNFPLELFAHYAFYNTGENRVEMHLVSLEDQAVRVAGETFEFQAGESIRTESSYKYTPAGFGDLAAEAGFRRRHLWTDPERLFSVHYLDASSSCSGGIGAP